MGGPIRRLIVLPNWSFHNSVESGGTFPSPSVFLYMKRGRWANKNTVDILRVVNHEEVTWLVVHAGQTAHVSQKGEELVFPCYVGGSLALC